MKLMSARASRAPCPSAPRTARPTSSSRARSRGCRAPRRSPSAASARSRTAAARRGGVPPGCPRTSVPTGTLACGRFGSVSSSVDALLLDLIQLESRAAGSAARAPCSRREAASHPGPAASRARPRRPTAFCSRLSPSTSGIRRRRRDLERRRAVRAPNPRRCHDFGRPRGRRRGDRARTPGSSMARSYEGTVQRHRTRCRSCDTIARMPLTEERPDARSVRKAVFPAAGLGTRFLPATKAQPKEMLPLVDKPIIQYGVEEAVASGVDNIILVTGRGKNAIEDHFDVSVELETFLEARGKTGAARRDPQDLEPDQLRRTCGRASRSASATPCSSRATSSATSRSPSSSATT